MKEVYTLDDLRRWPAETPPLRLAVLGDPVAHSASPPMHNAALAACGIDARYTRLHLRAADLAETFRLLPQQGFIGVNCTIPHKAGALAAVDEADDGARRAGGVNTVLVGADGRLRGFSTDGPGFERAVREEFGAELRDLRVLVLGAGGGAGRAVAMHCAAAGARRLTLINRSVEKLQPLHDAIAAFYPRAQLSLGPEAAALDETDLVVNCTSLGMKPDDPAPIAPALLARRHLLYDTIYTAARTPLMRAADTAGARSANGLAMLLHQGALSFEIWFQREAPLEAMRAALLAHTAAR